MSKGGSRYGRRSNWFKIHCLLQEQQQQAVEAAGKGGAAIGAPMSPQGFGDMAAAAAAQQHMQQQRNSHMAMGGLLGYSSYLPEMMGGSSAFSAGVRHPADAVAAAAALPFFNMMSMGTPQSAFQLPPHLLFPGYTHSAAAAAAADAAYRTEMFKHRQSVDSTASAESQRFSPASAHVQLAAAASAAVREELQVLSPVAGSTHSRESPELCVSGDDVPRSQTIYSPVAIRVSPQMSSSSPLANVSSPTAELHNNNNNSSAEQLNTSLSFAAKMQSLSPVSVCSISAETSVAAAAAAVSGTNQDGPMDLSMKTSRSSVQSFNSSSNGIGESELPAAHENSDDEQGQVSLRRKYQQLEESHASDLSCDDAVSNNSEESVKRQKLNSDVSNSYNGFAHSNAATSLRRIFVCV